MPFTGKEIGEIILEEQNISNVSINSIKQLDHYNPVDKKIHISEDKINKKVLQAYQLLHMKLDMQFKIEKVTNHLN